MNDDSRRKVVASLIFLAAGIWAWSSWEHWIGALALFAGVSGLLYVGYLPFADPRKLKYDIKGHMVRPKKVHVANKICFTLGGGEQTYNLGCYQISADWVGSAPKKIVEQVILPQLEFYKKLSGIKLPLVYELAGVLGEKVAQKNLKALEKIGLKLSPFA